MMPSQYIVVLLLFIGAVLFQTIVQFPWTSVDSGFSGGNGHFVKSFSFLDVPSGLFNVAIYGLSR